MSNSLKCKIKKLMHDNKITYNEYIILINKLAGHDAEVRAKALDDAMQAVYDASRYEYMGVYEAVNAIKEVKDGKGI